LFHKYIKLNVSIKKQFDEKWSELTNGHRVVGCLLRGTDYVLLKPQNHPIQPVPEVVCEKIKEVMQMFRCTHVFLATEDADILELFKKIFGNSLLYIDQVRISKKNMDPKSFLSLNKNCLCGSRDLFKDALDYLFATYVLSKCNCFVSGITGGMKGVLLMTNGFEYQYIYNLGVYK
jgi:hypothetical protein